MCCRIFLTPASVPTPQLPLWTPQTFIVLASNSSGTTSWQVSSNHMLLQVLTALLFHKGASLFPLTA